MIRGYAKTSFGQMHYYSQGEGPVVLLIHQALRSGYCYHRMMPAIAKKYRAIAVDLPGRGASDPIPAPFTVPDMAKAVIECLDDLGIEKFRVFGGHTGAAMSVELAAAHPKRVEAAALLAFPYIHDEDERKRLLALVDAGINRTPGPGTTGFPIVDAEASGAHLARIWHWISVRLWQGKGGMPEEAISEEDAGFITDFLVDILRARKDSGANTVRAVFKYNSKDRLPLIQAPTLLLEPAGTHERGPTLRADLVQKLIPRSKKLVVHNGDSYATYFISKELSDTIVQFFDKPGI